MLSSTISLSNMTDPGPNRLDPFGRSRAAVIRAGQLYASFIQRGKLYRFFQTLRRKAWEMENLSLHAVIRGRYLGIRTVALSQVRGSESRVRDFDRGFHPISEHTRERWQNIAITQLLCQCLPPVELFQLGNRYFIRDGHHRISVARALGQKAIEAVVTCVENCED